MYSQQSPANQKHTAATAATAAAVINEVRVHGESCGGIVTCVVRNCPRGLGNPVFDKLEAELGKAMMSLPATKGFEIGSGFQGARMTGSQHNDPFYMENGQVRTKTNRSGGIQVSGAGWSVYCLNSVQ